MYRIGLYVIHMYSTKKTLGPYLTWFLAVTLSPGLRQTSLNNSNISGESIMPLITFK